MRYKIGTDPEMFLKAGGKFVPACGLFPGTKDKPFEVECGAVQVDGLALEFNINPVENEDEFVKNIATVLTQVDEMIAKVDIGMTRVFTPWAAFDVNDFTNLTPEQKMLGCDPDYSGASGKVNPRPEIQDCNFRTAAGHIHIGWTEGADKTDPVHFEDCRFVAHKIGMTRRFACGTDEEYRRIQYYGKNSAFRPKSYGVEIRFPSNTWLQSEHSQRMAYRKVIMSMKEIEAA